MRKLLVRLVAVETALVGWLLYWLFLVYANNPSISDQLSSSLQRFPQLTFSTVDIAVLAIIAILAVTLAFKFQRGLRPGLRLERALQMLENLMKRNLILEAQVAELKIEKAHTPPVIAPATSSSEPRPGSWEKAFRTPLEAGPPLIAKASGSGKEDVPFGHETGIPPPRIESKHHPTPPVIRPTITMSDKDVGGSAPPTILSEKDLERQTFTSSPKSTSSSWEDSPQFLGESKGILTPSPPPKRAPSVSGSGLKQPYIPAPAAKAPSPGVIVGPMSSSSPLKIPSLSAPKISSRPPARPTASPKSSTITSRPPPPSVETPKPDTALPATTPPPSSPVPITGPIVEDSATKPETPLQKPAEETSKLDDKGTQPTRKKSQPEENQTLP